MSDANLWFILGKFISFTYKDHTKIAVFFRNIQLSSFRLYLIFVSLSFQIIFYLGLTGFDSG